jgi:hypothetical protein
MAEQLNPVCRIKGLRDQAGRLKAKGSRHKVSGAKFVCLKPYALRPTP